MSFLISSLSPSQADSNHSRGSEIEDCDVSVCYEESHAPPAKKMKAKDGVEDEMIKCIRDIRERRDRKQAQENEDDHYGRHVAAVMKRLPNRAKALARLQIEQVLLNAEFPETEQTSYDAYSNF